MKISCTQENLSKGLAIVSHSIGKDSTLPILANVLLETENKRLKLTTTNLEIGASCLVGAKVESDGKITVPAQLLHNYVNNLPTDKVDLEIKESSLKLSSGTYKANIKGIDPKEFPLIPKIEVKPFAVLSGKDLKEALNQVVYSAAHDESRPEIAGIYLKLSKGKLYLAATDSYRLAEKKLKPSQSQEKELDMIVPLSAMQELSRVLTDEVEIVELSTSENQIKFVFEDIELVSRLIEGQYPEYSRIIPKEFDTQALVKNSELSTALRTGSFFSSRDIAEVVVKTNPKEGLIEIVAESGEVGKNITKVRAQGVSGKEKEISFNPVYLLDCLSNIGTDEVYLMITADERVGALKPVGDAEKNYTYVVMPIVKK